MPSNNVAIAPCFPGGTNDVSEQDAVWLKAKADDFFRSGDFRSALNAYDAALDCDTAFRNFKSTSAAAVSSSSSVLEYSALQDSTIKCLSNRSACNLKLGLLDACYEDCTAGLLLAQLVGGSSGPVDINLSSEAGTKVTLPVESDTRTSQGDYHAVKLLARRGACLCQMGKFVDALSDYHSAVAKLQKLPGSKIAAMKGISMESLHSDITRLKLLHDSDRLKKEADALFAERELSAAAKKYDQALALVPIFVSAISNRSAVKLALDDLTGCIEDCSAAIALLEYGSPMSTASVQKGGKAVTQLSNPNMMMMLTSILPPLGSERRISWIVRTRSRRAMAFSQLTGKKTTTINSSNNASPACDNRSDSGVNALLHLDMAKLTPLQCMDLAIADLEAACSLDINNEHLKNDLNNWITIRDGLMEQQTTVTN
jgi:tetratricopeptide (TPR) repeat protein